jgi:hypothetical protein
MLHNSAFYGDFVTGNNKTYLGLPVKYPMLIIPFLTTSGFFSANLHEVYNIKFQRNRSCERHDDNMRTAGRTDMKKLNEANFATIETRLKTNHTKYNTKKCSGMVVCKP